MHQWSPPKARRKWPRPQNHSTLKVHAQPPFGISPLPLPDGWAYRNVPRQRRHESTMIPFHSTSKTNVGGKPGASRTYHDIGFLSLLVDGVSRPHQCPLFKKPNSFLPSCSKSPLRCDCASVPVLLQFFRGLPNVGTDSINTARGRDHKLLEHRGGRSFQHTVQKTFWAAVVARLTSPHTSSFHFRLEANLSPSTNTISCRRFGRGIQGRVR
mmetsp:Transcript_4167/g.8042  ORF Transcript_4167/g.8042 Transcript_4167/m.8042 type:complete len:212 (-) Transcript_4167:23-658(-)